METRHKKNHLSPSVPGGLSSLWIEIPAFCHLTCAYCYAGSGRTAHKSTPGALSLREYRDLINAFADAGGTALAIPGRGEPFHPKNEALVREIIALADRRGIGTTIFTTGETLLYTKEGSSPYRRRAGTGLIDFLASKKVALFIKYNSRNPAVQDRLVAMDGYTGKRDEAIDVLVNTYGLHKHKRIGIVTSVMTENETEILDLYEYATANGLVFDCDTILPLGRGKVFNESSGVPDERYRAIAAELCRRRNIVSHPGGTYVGAVCDRIRHHLYVDLSGNVYPCLGARGRIALGNIRELPLAELWGSQIRQQLRNDRFSVFRGVCSRCANFHAGDCFSCLGRAVDTVRIDREREEITLETRGCFNHRPVLGLWTRAVGEYLCRPGSGGVRRHRKNFKEEDLSFPMNKIWQLVDLKARRGDKRENAVLASAKVLFSRVPDLRRLMFEFKPKGRHAVLTYTARNGAAACAPHEKVFTGQNNASRLTVRSNRPLAEHQAADIRRVLDALTASQHEFS